MRRWRKLFKISFVFFLITLSAIQLLDSNRYSVEDGNAANEDHSLVLDSLNGSGQNGDTRRSLLHNAIAKKNQQVLVKLANHGNYVLNQSLSQSKDLRLKILSPIQGIRKSDENVYDKTSKETQTELQDLFISVKTTGKYHKSRLDTLLDTWISVAKHETYIFTDVDDEYYNNKTGGRMINTECPRTHRRAALCCKMAVEFDAFIESQKRWFCHMDDDTYLNIPKLLRVLRQYNHTDDWYIGKPSLGKPLTVYVPARDEKSTFWFATGGAGLCLSRGIALKMAPYIGGGKFKEVCEMVRLPDDCTLGYVIYILLKKELTVNKSFHSHLEGLSHIKAHNIKDQVTFSYTKYNILHIQGFNHTYDPTRFYSIHCELFPETSYCS